MMLGSEWVQEDVIYLKNINLPRLQTVDPKVDLGYLHEGGEHWLKKRQFGIETLTKNLSHDELESLDKESGTHERYQPNIQGIFIYARIFFHKVINPECSLIFVLRKIVWVLNVKYSTY